MPTRLPDPYSHPNIAPGFKAAPITDNEPVLQDELPNGTVLETSSGAQYWSTTITYGELTETEFRIIQSAILQAKVSDGILQVVLPQYVNASRVTAGEDSLGVTSGQLGTTIVLSNAATLQGRPYIGDAFRIKSHNKVYRITGITEDSSANTLTLNIYPKLIKPTVSSDKVTFNEIIFSMKLLNRQSIQENLTVEGFYEGFTLALREVTNG